MQAAIEARAVGVRTRAGEVVVRDISLTAGQGELVAITGTGPGKTALLDALSGLRPPTSGVVGRCSGAGSAPRRGYLPADDVLFPVLPLATALRFTAAVRAVHGTGRAVDDALTVTGLAARATARCGELAPGERARAAVAAELLSRPDQLFLDGPTARLDPAQAAEVLSLLRRLAASGVTVVFTTSSPLDVARCDKVAVLAAGGDLAFFGTPDAAQGYFGADSLEEIYERLAGVGDPASAWSRRFFHFSQATAGFAPWVTPALAAGPAYLLPDSAGPHSAGRVTARPAAQADPAADPPGLAPAVPGRERPDRGAVVGHTDVGRPDVGHTAVARTAVARAARPLPVLVRRNVEVGRRSAAACAVLAGAPAAVLVAFAALIGAGALDAGRACLAWTVLGGFCIGLAYGLPQVGGELGALRAERFCGLSAAGYVAAKLAVLLPVLAAADAIALAGPAGFGRLPQGYGPAYLTVLLSSAVALTFALLLSANALLPVSALLPARAAARGRPRTARPPAAAWLPALLLAGAILALVDHPWWPDWLVLALLAAAFAAGLTALIGRRVPAALGARPAARF